ncbi:hypothetical protein KEM54_004762, partial [Ascosphaera aggregata]
APIRVSNWAEDVEVLERLQAKKQAKKLRRKARQQADRETRKTERVTAALHRELSSTTWQEVRSQVSSDEETMARSKSPDQLTQTVKVAEEAHLARVSSTLAGAQKIEATFDGLRADKDIASSAALCSLLERIKREVQRFVESGFIGSTQSSKGGFEL